MLLREDVWLLILFMLITGNTIFQGVRADVGDGKGEKIETIADSLNYNRDSGIVDAVGNVMITHGEFSLKADRVQIDVNKEEATATGNVRIIRGNEEWTGHHIKYNFSTGDGVAEGEQLASSEPFLIKGDRVERSEDAFILYNASATTCANLEEKHHFHITAKQMELKADKYLKAKGAVWWFGKVPSMYLPYYIRNLDEDFGWDFDIGHTSDMGAFFLNSYYYRLNAGLKGETHLDFRTKRGVGVGQDFQWNFGSGKETGDLSLYYLNDQDLDKDSLTKDINHNRYRIQLKEQYFLSENGTILVKAHYLSDEDILEDFFEDEFRKERQPLNYFSYTHSEENYTINGIFQPRLNDFYDSVNRLPEINIEVFRQPIQETSIFHESITSAAFLQRQFKKIRKQDDFESFRFDTAHGFFRPGKYFGFLTVVPRTRIRGTYYSDTLSTDTGLERLAVVSLDEAVMVGATTNAITGPLKGGASFRGLFELGFKTSFKAFRLLESSKGPRRHIVEPFLDYTLTFDPTISPEQLFQFDEIDAFDEENFFRLGVRKKYQSKRNEIPFDIIDAVFFTDLELNPKNDKKLLEDVSWDVEIAPARDLFINLDGVYNFASTQLDTFNAWILRSGAESIDGRIEYRYRREDPSSQFAGSSLFSADLMLYPMAPWSFGMYGRYQSKDSRLEEIGVNILRRFDCLVVRTGLSMLPGIKYSDGTEKDDNYRFLIEFWLTAYPGRAWGNPLQG